MKFRVELVARSYLPVRYILLQVNTRMANTRTIPSLGFISLTKRETCKALEPADRLFPDVFHCTTGGRGAVGDGCLLVKLAALNSASITARTA